MLLDEAANRLHAIGLRVPAERLRPATQTSPVSRMLGLFGPDEELNVLPARPARRARWTAIYPRARDCEDEFPIAGSIARDHGIPARVVGCLRRLNRRFRLTG